MAIPPTLVRPSWARLILEAAMEGVAVAWGSRALSSCQRCPRAERTSASERSSPRLCFNPRSMASCSESGMTPGTTLVGTLPANGLGPLPPERLCAGVLEIDVETVCAKDIAVPQIKSPVQRNRSGAGERTTTCLLKFECLRWCDELSACRRHRLAMYPSELGYGLMVHIEPGEQPHQIDIAAALRLQMPRRANLIQIIVQI